MDGAVVSIELTLISIIQGVALYFLVDNARRALADGAWERIPYVVSGLAVIFLFWSRSLIHTLTVIRWPLDFAHNFAYVACTLVEAVIFTQMADPFAWHVLNGMFGLMIWALFILDLGMISARAKDSPGPSGNKLYAGVREEQFLNIYFLMPATVGFSFTSAAAVYFWPAFFIGRGFHVWVAVAQGAGAFGYLFYVMRFFKGLGPLIEETHEEWAGE